MSTISNRFYVTALEDGTTLHGNLVSDKALSQAWNGSSSSAVPDWTVAENQPTIYLTLMSGNELTPPSSNYTWYYNGTAITFNPTTGESLSPQGLFLKTTKNVTYGGQTKTMPALKIIGNLAASSNTDVDTIMFKGEHLISGTGVDFSATAQIRISTVSAGSHLGVINFVDGVSDITEANQTITMYGILYDDTGNPVSNVTTKWYLNDATVGTNGQEITVASSGTYANAFQVTESQVVDHATVRCEFYVGNDLKHTAYAAVDDMQDPEFMYIQNNGANGNAASLRSGETASFQIWVGKRDDAGVLGGSSTPTYPIIKVKLLDGNGDTITGSGLSTNIPDPDTNGYRTLTMSGGKGSLTPHYDTVNAYGKNITGIVVAYTS